MYIVGDLSIKGDLKTVFNKIMKYLKENQLLITDEQGTPLNEVEISEILKSNNSYHFRTSKISIIEDDFIKNTIDYINKAETLYKEIAEAENEGLIIQAFIDLTNSLAEIQKVSGYFNIHIISIEQINNLASMALEKVQQGDIEFVNDIIEYEILPQLVDFKTKLLERQSH